MSYEDPFPDLDVSIKELKNDRICFDIGGIDSCMANAIRRSISDEVETMAIHRVIIRANETPMPDLFLARRLGLIPLRADAYQFETCDDTNYTKDNCLLYRLRISKKEVAEASMTPLGHLVVYSGALEWIPIGDQLERLRWPPRPLFEDIPITKLRRNPSTLSPGECEGDDKWALDVEMYAKRGCGLDHAKWRPCSVAFFRPKSSLKIITVDGDNKENDEEEKRLLARRLVSTCPTGAIQDKRLCDIEDKEWEDAGCGLSYSSRLCVLCQECTRVSNDKQIVKLNPGGDEGPFFFTVECDAAIGAAACVDRGIRALGKKVLQSV